MSYHHTDQRETEKASRTLLYIRGKPGVGKITVARLLEEELHWPVLWFHSFDWLRPLFGEKADEVIGDLVRMAISRVPGDLIYVRPSRTRDTVNRVRSVAESLGYRFICVRLIADYDVLVDRVSCRQPTDFRINNKAGLDAYLAKGYEDVPNEILMSTHLPPPTVVRDIKRLCMSPGPLNN